MPAQARGARPSRIAVRVLRDFSSRSKGHAVPWRRKRVRLGHASTSKPKHHAFSGSAARPLLPVTGVQSHYRLPGRMIGSAKTRGATRCGANAPECSIREFWRVFRISWSGILATPGFFRTEGDPRSGSSPDFRFLASRGRKGSTVALAISRGSISRRTGRGHIAGRPRGRRRCSAGLRLR